MRSIRLDDRQSVLHPSNQSMRSTDLRGSLVLYAWIFRAEPTQQSPGRTSE